jgi:hypothetical protein
MCLYRRSCCSYCGNCEGVSKWERHSWTGCYQSPLYKDGRSNGCSSHYILTHTNVRTLCNTITAVDWNDSCTSAVEPAALRIHLGQRFSNFLSSVDHFYQSECSAERSTLVPLSCLRFSTTVCDTQFTLIFFLFFFTNVQSKRTTRAEPEHHL